MSFLTRLTVTRLSSAWNRTAAASQVTNTILNGKNASLCTHQYHGRTDAHLLTSGNALTHLFPSSSSRDLCRTFTVSEPLTHALRSCESSPYLSTRFNNCLYWNDETTSYLELFEGKMMYELMDGSEHENAKECSSVLKKRKLKMKRHKYRKWRKRMRFKRRALK